MRLVAVSQRVSTDNDHGERRDCLDQAWPRFLAACGLLPLPLPNVPDLALSLCRNTQVAGLVLTGGNDLEALGGDAPERDAAELAVLDDMLARRLPVIGVCRGMQLIQHRDGVPLRRVDGHVTRSQSILVNGRPTTTNSFHRFGSTQTRPPLAVWAVAPDGVVKAVRDPARSLTGIMWHPERNLPFDAGDIELFGHTFGVT